MDREKLLHEIMALDFAIVDLNLYLDTHPYDQKAISLFNEIVQKSKMLKENYQTMFGPLCASMFSGSKEKWLWIENPWPWNRTSDEMEVEC